MAAAEAEVTIICIDNSERVISRKALYYAQLEAIKLYCTTNLKCNPENAVGLYSMAKGRYGPLLSPTNSLKEILCRLEKGFKYGGEVEFASAIASACKVLSSIPPHMERRLLMFVGGPINLHPRQVKLKGTLLKHCGAALDVVNFFSPNIDCNTFGAHRLLTSRYRYAKKELDRLVTFVNDNDNSHLVNVAEDKSSVVEILSNSSILKKDIGKKAAADDEHVKASRIKCFKTESKNKSVADDEYGRAPGTEYGRRRENLSRCRICEQVLEMEHFGDLWLVG